MIGRTLDNRYRILSLLGEGGMGKVYLAEHTTLKKRMAVKVIHEEYSHHPEVARRFQQEAIAASQIGSENIVNVTDFGHTDEGALYFVMEELRGESLAQVIRREGQLPPGRALPILGQLCRALSAAHARGIVHRDLKPENVMLVQVEDRAEVVKVLDFGISKVAVGAEGERITRLGMIVGTPEYMAPEQASGDQVDHRVDIYSAGVVAYELLTGTLPFSGNNPLQILVKQQSEEALPIRQRRPELELPEDLEQVVARAMAKAPEDRPQTMAELAAELSLCAERLGLRPIALSNPAGVAVSPAHHGPPTIDVPRPAGAAVQLPPTQLSNRLYREEDLVPSGPHPQVPEAPAVPGREHPSTLIMWSRRNARFLVPALLVVALGAGGWLVVRHPPPPPAAEPVAAAPAQTPATPEVVVAAAPVAAPPKVEPAVEVEPLAPPSTTRTIELTTRPAGATVSLGGTVLGVTPLKVSLAEGTEATYGFVLDGYRPVHRRVTSTEEQVKLTLEHVATRRNSKRSTPARPVRTSSDGLKDVPF